LVSDDDEWREEERRREEEGEVDADDVDVEADDVDVEADDVDVEADVGEKDGRREKEEVEGGEQEERLWKVVDGRSGCGVVVVVDDVGCDCEVDFCCRSWDRNDEVKVDLVEGRSERKWWRQQREDMVAFEILMNLEFAEFLVGLDGGC
jgi:hypothetical protein